MTKTCFIVNELYPKDLGGIGRLMHNILQHSHAINPDAELHVVLTAQRQSASQELIDFFADIATFHFFDTDENIAKNIGVSSLKNAAALRHLKQPVLTGLRILDTVLAAQNQIGADFDHIEIPDHMGVSALLISAKRSGIAFENTEITCRIHSSLSAIIAHEPFYHNRSDWLAPRLEMEHQSLRDADRIIAHFPSIADFNQQHFDLPKTWKHKVETSFPPAIWPAETAEITQTDPNADFIFTSRFQPFKRPELFIKAALALLESGSDYSGKFRLISYGFDREYIDSLRLMIPPKWRGRIRIEIDLPGDARKAAIQSGITVQPSAFESLCALAYEVSAAGRPILLAQDCLAFGKNERWNDGENCLLFPPTPQGLAKTMEKSRTWQPKSVANTTADPCYFHKPVTQNAKPKPHETALILIGPLLTKMDFEIFGKTNFGKFQKQAFASPENIARFAPDNPEDILKIPPSEFCGTVLRQTAARAGHPVLFATSNALPSQDFITTGLTCLTRGVVFSTNSKNLDGRLNIYPGKMPSIAATDYRLMPLCFMLHPADLDIINDQDDTHFMQRLLARIARSDLDIVLCPRPLVIETSPLIDIPPSRNLLGFDPDPHWKNQIQSIAIDVKTAQFTELLKDRPANFKQNDIAGAFKVKISCEQPNLVQLQSETSVSGQILAVKIRNTGKTGKATVSLHQTTEPNALERHNSGQNCRVIRANQTYQMRWGPMNQAAAPVLVLSADQDTEVEIDEFLVISRE